MARKKAPTPKKQAKKPARKTAAKATPARAAAPKRARAAAGQADTVVLMARDPLTAFAYWDLAPKTEAEAEKARGAKPVVRVLRGGEVERTVEVELGWRGVSLKGLVPGAEYRVELAIEGGKSRWSLGTSNPMTMPPAGPSDRVEDAFVTVPWDRSPASFTDLEARRVPSEPISDADRARLYALSGGGRRDLGSSGSGSRSTR